MLNRCSSVCKVTWRRFSTTSPPKVIIDECLKLRMSIQELNDKFKGPLPKNSQTNTFLPFVFLLGNHSSGKSSFVNYILQRKIQAAGVAPTDDSFTVIAPGLSDIDRDGPSFIGDPDMGFSGLRNFGPTLMHHTNLKVRSGTKITDFMIVDTPGMIDSARVSGGRTSSPALLHHDPLLDRGYDFEKVCRWYAERADVILLFFDPDKPGTTGETLTVLTNSLAGLDHKLHIILNKADQFEKIHDFARAYGSLCWNLSKVIHRKDLPRIYTMCLPPNYQVLAPGQPQTKQGTEVPRHDERSSLGKGLIDLEVTREEVVKEVLNAPKRRIDNEISRLHDSTQLLLMHCKLVDGMVGRYNSVRRKAYLAILTIFTGTFGIPALELSMAIPWEVVVGTSGVGVVASMASTWYTSQVLKDTARRLTSIDGLESMFRNLYGRQIAENDEFIQSLWSRVKNHMRISIQPEDLGSLSRLKSAELTMLNRLLEESIPRLRRETTSTLSSQK